MIHRLLHIVQGFHIEHQHAGGNGQRARRDHPAEHLVDQDDLIAHGISVRQRVNLYMLGELLIVLYPQPLGRMLFDA